MNSQSGLSGIENGNLESLLESHRSLSLDSGRLFSLLAPLHCHDLVK